MTKKSIPEVRFKAFSGSWEKLDLSDKSFEITAGGDVEKTKLFSFGKYPVIANALTDEGIIGYYNDSFRISGPAVTVTGRGDVGHARAREFDFTPVVRLLTIKSYHNVSFLENAINNHGVMVESTGVPQLTVPQLKKFEIYFPGTLDEEIKTGDFFKKLNQLLSLQSKKYENLLNIKKSMLEKMFPKDGTDVPEIRIKCFNESWERHSLSDLGKATSGTSIESEFLESGTYKVISIGSYSEQSKYTDQGLRVSRSEKTENRILNKGDLTMVLNDKTATGRIIGRVLLIEENDTYVYNQRTQRIEPYRDQYDSQFLYQMLNAPLLRAKIVKQSQGNTQIYVNWSGIRDLEYMIPSLEEQIKIGNYFKNLDTLISLHSEELEKLKTIKKAMLEKMFV